MRENLNSAHVCVIGGGASAMAGAITAARAGCKVAVLERLDRVGKKVLQTGNGRCNITNKNISIKNFNGKNPAFAMKVFEDTGLSQTIDFFQGIGVIFAEEKDGKLFPQSFQASSVLDLLRAEMQRLGVLEVTNFFVRKIEINNEGFKAVSDTGDCFYAKKVIIATGGAASPKTGTDGSGYKLLTSLGHTLVKPLPSLVQLKAQSPIKGFKGIKQNGEVTVFVEGSAKKTEKGEVLFTVYGLSGPPVFNVSPIVSAAAAMNKKAEIKINFLPHFSKAEVKSLVENRARDLPYLWGEDFLNGILNKRIGKYIMKNSSKIEDIVNQITAFTVNISGTMPFASAQVTAGGICTAEFSPHTMESHIVPGLYAAGEVLDIDGDCGGYNLQWAWSSGILAGKQAGHTSL